MTLLKTTSPGYRDKLTGEFLAGQKEINLSDYSMPFDRDVNLEHLENIINKAMTKFGDPQTSVTGTAAAAKSDRWLAPRVHCSLRLTRREAALHGVWDWLALDPFNNYVRWRWGAGDGKVASDRFVSRDVRKHAIKRLWWGAELTRNGGDYSATDLLFTSTDVPNSWLNQHLFRHRPTAIASLRLLSTLNDDGSFASSDRQRDLIKAMNAAITTTMLDAVAHSKSVDSDTVDQWRHEPIDETAWFEQMPAGPDELPLEDSEIEAVHELLERVLDKMTFGKRNRSGEGTSNQAADTEASS